jgi:glycosyltransferase involved in cell wall biosynthesis
MICYYYPPLTDVGCKRSVAFSKYFKKHGWNPYVLSVKNPDKTYCSLGNDKPPAGIHTEYTYSLFNIYKFFGKLNGIFSRIFKLFSIKIQRNYFYDFFCIPDCFIGWIPLATIKALSLIKKYHIDIIYISCTPFSSAIIGFPLKYLSNKPLVIDFRDPFALEEISTILRKPKIRNKIDKLIEKNIIKNADIFIVTSNEIKEMYDKQYPQAKNKTFTIYNGFDTELILKNRQIEKYQKFTIIYTGEFYFYALDSEIFFEGLSILKKKGRLTKNNFQFLFYGNGKSKIQQLSKKYEVERIVSANARVPYKNVLAALRSSHLQLLRIIKPMISTKLFEGIPLNLPFLATIPTGEVEEIIKKYSPSSYIITEESAEKVANAILDAMVKYEQYEIMDNHVSEFLKNFSRENLTQKLMRLIEERLG